jgi:hypothetical protein
MEHTQYPQRMDEINARIQSIKNWPVRTDLTKILRNCRDLYTQMDREHVICRRTQRTTAAYATLSEQLDTWLHMLEKRITWALML